MVIRRWLGEIKDVPNALRPDLRKALQTVSDEVPRTVAELKRAKGQCQKAYRDRARIHGELRRKTQDLETQEEEEDI